MEQQNYSVYEIYFEETNEVFYVGVTTTHVLVRLGRHLGMQKQDGNLKLKKALIDYWEKGIKYNIRSVKSNLNKHDALAEERFLIKKYKDNVTFFNVSGNPNTLYKESIEVCKIDMDTLEVIKTYPSLRSTEKDGYSYPNIVQVCERKNCHVYGFYWCYKTDLEKFKPKTKVAYTRPVKVFDKSGTLLHEFNSMTEAANYFDVSIQTISRFIKERDEWKVYGKSYTQDKKATKYKKIQVFNTKGELIETVSNISDYCREHHIDISTAYKIINGKKQSTKGITFKVETYFEK